MSLYFTIGIPRSGKSTICDQWSQYKFDLHPDLHGSCNIVSHDTTVKHNPRTIVCSDDIRIALYQHRFIYEAEEMVHAIQKIMIKSLLNRGFDVIVDGTHTTYKNIKRLLQIDNYAYYFIKNTNVELCVARAKASDQHDLIPTIYRLHAQLQCLLPNLDKTMGTIRQSLIQNNNEHISN